MPTPFLFKHAFLTTDFFYKSARLFFIQDRISKLLLSVSEDRASLFFIQDGISNHCSMLWNKVLVIFCHRAFKPVISISEEIASNFQYMIFFPATSVCFYGMHHSFSNHSLCTYFNQQGTFFLFSSEQHFHYLFL